MVRTKVNELEALLRPAFGDQLAIVDQKTSLLTAPGEHYGSIMLALDLTVKTSETADVRTLNLVAKLIPANQMLRVAFDVGVTFKKEVWAYTETLPALDRFSASFGGPAAPPYSALFPKCYGARLSLASPHVDEDAVLLFENLRPQGYRTEDRLRGLDLPAARLVLAALARFHAEPLALRRRDPAEFARAVQPALARNAGLERLPAAVRDAFRGAILAAAARAPELAALLPRLRALVAAPPAAPPAEAWGTMAHADFWVSNVMLSGDGACRIVDLQIMRFASCARDLVFFLFTSVQNAVLAASGDELIRAYHAALVGHLARFGVDAAEYGWEAFRAELEAVAPTEAFHVLVMLKPVCTERGKVENSLEDFQDSDWSREDLLGPNHQRKLTDTVLALAERNWL